jgi:hypothetical protein
VKIIGLVGHARCGKDTVGQMICTALPGARTLSFAEPLKTILKDLFDWTDEHVSGSLKEVGDPRYPRPPAPFHAETSATLLTPRYAMQTLGTEWGRRCYDRIWIDYALRRAAEMLRRGAMVTRRLGLLSDQAATCVVITDVRFVNEAQAIYDAGGCLWRITRPNDGAAGGIANHASETEMDSPGMAELCNTYLANDGDLILLRSRVRAALAGSGHNPFESVS